MNRSPKSRTETLKDVLIEWLLRLIDPTQRRVYPLPVEPTLNPHIEMAPGIVRPTSVLIRLLGEEMIRRTADEESYKYRLIEYEESVLGCVWSIEDPQFIEARMSFNQEHDWLIYQHPEIDLLSDFHKRVMTRLHSLSVEIRLGKDLIELNDYESMLMLRIMVEFRRFKKKQVEIAADFAIQKVALKAVESLLLSGERGQLVTGQPQFGYETYNIAAPRLPDKVIAIPTLGQTLRRLDKEPEPANFTPNFCVVPDCLEFQIPISEYCDYHRHILGRRSESKYD